MASAPDLTERRREAEWMDDPELDAGLHAEALEGLARLHVLSQTERQILPVLRRVSERLDRPVRLLDLASGRGDVLLRLGRRARRAGLALRLEGCDLSSTAVEQARARSAELEIEAEFFQHDCIGGGVPEGYDVVSCSLFLHHLDEDQALGLLREMGSRSKECALVHDLMRTRTGWWLAMLGSRLATRSPVVHNDALASVRGAFDAEEAVELARRAGWSRIELERGWPARFTLVGGS